MRDRVNISLCLAAVLVLRALAASAGEPAPARSPGPRCPDGSKPRFTGHPFQPLFCPDPQSAAKPPAISAEMKLSSSSLPGTKEKEKASLKSLVGRWEGLTVYGAGRYELLCEIQKGRGNSFVIRFGTKEYHIHDKTEFTAEFKGSIWRPGQYGVSVQMRGLSEARLEAQAWLGSAVKQGEAKPEFDRELVLTYKGRPELHKLQFTLEGKNKIRYAYTFLGPERGPVGASGELVRSHRESL